jgi:carboxypeptidase Q
VNARPTLLLFAVLCAPLACFDSSNADPSSSGFDSSAATESGTTTQSDPAADWRVGWNLPDDETAAARVTELLDRGLNDRAAFDMLSELCTQAPKRLAGSPGFEKAVDWGFETMNRIGLQNVRREPVMVPRWVRGSVETCVAKDRQDLPLVITALGGSIATGPGGITAEVVEVDGLKGIEQAGEKLRGKIAFLNQPMRANVRNTGRAYGEAVPQRTGGATAAIQYGAVAVLVRSMSTAMDDVPHTGAMRYKDGVGKIPAAALGVLSAIRLSDALKQGPVQVTLTLECETLPEIEQWNVIGEIPGSDLAEEYIVVGGHLDAWGTGVGAHDDGAGCAHSLEAARLLVATGFRPRRTIRVILFANEENGMAGGKGYAARHGESEKHFLAMESDSGGFGPRGLGLSRPNDIIDRFRPLGKPLGQIGAERIFNGGGGADIGPLTEFGCITSSLKVNDERYFDLHHSANDTLDFVNPRELELGSVVVAYWLSIFANVNAAALEPNQS